MKLRTPRFARISEASTTFDINTAAKQILRPRALRSRLAAVEQNQMLLGKSLELSPAIQLVGRISQLERGSGILKSEGHRTLLIEMEAFSREIGLTGRGKPIYFKMWHILR